MASESLPLQSSPPAPVHKGNEQSQPFHNVLDTTQTDSGSFPAGKSQVAANHERPATPKSAAETEFVAKQPTEHPVAAAIASSETQVPVEATGAVKEPPGTKPEPQTGEKRDLDSSTTSAATPALEKVTEDQDKPAPEKSDEPDSKKQKTGKESAPQGTGLAPVAAATAPASEGPKKSARSKKEKVKEALKKIPSEGISSRTRSRTKAT